MEHPALLLLLLLVGIHALARLLLVPLLAASLEVGPPKQRAVRRHRVQRWRLLAQQPSRLL